MAYKKIASALIATCTLSLSSISLNEQNMVNLTDKLKATYDKICSYEKNETFLLESYNSLKSKAEVMIEKANAIIADKNQKIEELENQILVLNSQVDEVIIDTNTVELEESSTEVINHETIDMSANNEEDVNIEINFEETVSPETNTSDSTSIDKNNIEVPDLNIN